MREKLAPTKAVRSGVASARATPESAMSERSYQVASKSALNIARGGQAFSPFGPG
jgi:hypothetical protein